jgi:uncharacterized protein YqiB (DUF1249 family)
MFFHVRNYTVTVRVADACDAGGNPLPSARVRTWRLATFIGREGFDKTP